MSRIKQFFENARITRGALYVLFLELGFSIMFWILTGDAKQTLGENAIASGYTTWTELRVWTVFTSPLILLSRQWLNLIFHGLILWMFVPVLENWWGTKRFIKFVVITSVVATLVGSFTGQVLGGAYLIQPINGLDAFIYASIVAYGILYKDRDVYFFGVLPMKGKQLMIGIIIFVALFIILQAAWVQGAGYASAMTAAWLLVSGRWNPKLWRLKWRKRKAERKLKLLKGGKLDTKKPKKNGKDDSWLN